ncbi:GNAT family N-acetyltransferase [Kribbella sp. NPDC020789]
MTVFRYDDPVLGEFSLRPVDPAGDNELLYRWVTDPKSAYWLMQDASRDDVLKESLSIAAHPSHHAFLGLRNGTPEFLVERYDPQAELGAYYDYQPGDVGMHFLTAPTTQPVHGFTRAVITAVMEFLFADPAVRRVVVEPDVRNTAVHGLNAVVGFEVVGETALPTKKALLSLCTREQFLTKRGAA